MSWIVQNLLRNRLEIKSRADIESDDYNNVLLIEKAISDLRTIGALNSREVELLELISNGAYYEDIENQYHLNRNAISTHFIALCDRLAFYLGDEFTDEGYLSYMTEKYKLTEEQRQALVSFMAGKFKHKTSRKIHNESK